MGLNVWTSLCLSWVCSKSFDWFFRLCSHQPKPSASAREQVKSKIQQYTWNSCLYTNQTNRDQLFEHHQTTVRISVHLLQERETDVVEFYLVTPYSLFNEQISWVRRFVRVYIFHSKWECWCQFPVPMLIFYNIIFVRSNLHKWWLLQITW